MKGCVPHSAEPMPIRPLVQTDLPALHELALHAESEGFRFVRRLHGDLTLDHARTDASCECLVAHVDGDRLVAVGGVTPDPYVDDPRVGRLRHLYVRPEVRGTGIGRALVAHLEARAAGCFATLRLRTDTLAAARFYERLGYLSIESDSATHQRALATR